MVKKSTKSTATKTTPSKVEAPNKAEMPMKTIPEPEKVQVNPDFVGTMSMGSTYSGPKTVGKNKSGMPWKKGSTRSKFSKGPSISYQRSIEERERLKRIKEIETRLKDARKNGKVDSRRKQREKQERKAINEFKSSTYQTVSISNFVVLNEYTLSDLKPVQDAYVVSQSQGNSHEDASRDFLREVQVILMKHSIN